MEWIDRTAYADAYTKYYGNRAQHQMKLTILNGYSSVATQDQTFLASSYWPSEQDYNSDLRFTAAESCGQSANLNTTHSAWFETFVVSGNMVVYRANDVPTQASAAQPACTREEDVAEPVGGGCISGTSCEDEMPDHGYSWCVVRYSYDMDTGEILGWRILYCY